MNITLNLLPWRVKSRQRRWRYSLLAVAMSVLAGSMTWWWLNTAADMELATQRQHNQALTLQLTELEARIEQFEHYLQQQRKQAIAHASLERERLLFPHLLAALARHTPNGVVLTDVQQQGGTLVIIARTTTSARIAHAVQQWEALGTGTPSISSIRADGQGGHTFSLSTSWPVSDQTSEVQIARRERRQ